mmetsp:Transcript_72724/g.117950  ORF Transcript_72724/g.117950 Transcript_72724/m.117950 type:complete len:431 (-) Transcript_72724:117-1409(-)
MQRATSGHNKCARWTAAFCFFLVTILIAASIGVLDWLSVRQSSTWEPGGRDAPDTTAGSGGGMSTGWMNNRTTLVYEQRFSVHGKVIESRTLTFGWVIDRQIIGHSRCIQFTNWNVWWETVETGCSQSHEGDLDGYPNALEWGEFVCNAICDDLNNGVKAQADADQVLSCGRLAEYAKENKIQDPAGPWNLVAICDAPKGVVAVLTLAMCFSVLGFLMCFCCSTRPRLLVIPSFLSCILAALSPIAYGAAVASVYPWQALQMDELLTVSFGGAAAASSDVATIRSGFALAIVSSVTAMLGSIFLVYNLYFVKVASADAGHELSIMSAVPVPAQSDPARGEQMPIAESGSAGADRTGARASNFETGTRWQCRDCGERHPASYQGCPISFKRRAESELQPQVGRDLHAEAIRGSAPSIPTSTTQDVPTGITV